MYLQAAVTGDNSAQLTEDDIPGAAWGGRDPYKLKKAELILWLRCRAESITELKTRVALAARHGISPK
jgi:hypothetical protein